MGRWSRALAPLFVRFAGVQHSDAVLDVGAGTGVLAEAVAAFAPASRVMGVDPAPSYVAFAQANRATERISFQVGDARQMRFDDRTFDRTLSMLVVNFVPDPDAALLEMRRVTRRGGTIAAAVWDYGDGMEMLRVFWDAAIALYPASDESDERHMRFCRQGELAELWSSRGLGEVTGEALTIETRFASFDDYWGPFQEKQGPAGMYVASLQPHERDALERRLRHRLLGSGPDRPITLSARAWAARGVVA